jgi:4-amino-4-deoxy-L-arabinose transferase-like glycosyltransferase
MLQKLFRTDTGILILLAAAFLALHVPTSSAYGFHRDELATLDDARHLEWGFVSYPPLTPAVGRLELALFGISTRGVRLAPILALGIAVILSGLMARELGGSRRAQVLTALAVAVVPLVNVQTDVLQYVSFDYLWGVLLTYLLLRLLNSGNQNALDPRWWVPIGAVIGLGMMTKYTMAFFTAGLVGGLVATGAFESGGAGKKIRSQLLSPWLWAGVTVSLLVFLPNLVWQIRHHFISLEFLHHIHVRDVGQGRTRGFLPQQLFVCVSVLMFPFVFMGLWFYFTGRGRKFRLLGWMFVLTLALFAVAQARSYYPGPLYPVVLAGGSVVWERWLAVRSQNWSRAIQGLTWFLVACSALLSFILFTPIAPINSALWNATGKIQDNFREEIGWTDLVGTVARVYDSIPASERAGAGIIVGNYGEAGAIDLFGPRYGLPAAISGTNSAWYRSYPERQPQTLIAVGLDDDFLKEHFERCEVAAQNINPYGVINEESRYHPNIYLCHHLLQPWPEFWANFQRFG